MIELSKKSPFLIWTDEKNGPMQQNHEKSGAAVAEKTQAGSLFLSLIYHGSWAFNVNKNVIP